VSQIRAERDDAETLRSGLAESLQISEAMVSELQRTIESFKTDGQAKVETEEKLRCHVDELTQENKSLTEKMETVGVVLIWCLLCCLP